MTTSVSPVSNVDEQRETQFPPVICVGFPRWEGGGYLSSTVQLMKELARSLRVLYVDYPFTYKDMWLSGQQESGSIPLAALAGKEPRLQQRQLSHGGSAHILRLPPFIPANFLRSAFAYDQLLKWNAGRATKAIRAAMDQLNWQAPIVINAFNPALGNGLAGKLDEQLLVYYCYDEISAAPWIARHGARHEQQFLQKADLTIVSSQGLYDHKASAAKQIALVKNGVDLGLFKTSGQRPSDLPEGPIIGYIGSVDDRLDYELLETIARSYPETPLVFLGRVVNERAAEQLSKWPNVHILGPRPPEQLGDYLAAFSVGLIPFVKNELTAGIYPLKINEYLALGVPVVSTCFADLSDFGDYIREGANTERFVEAIASLLSGAQPVNVEAGKAFAATNSWSGRADQLRALFATNLLANSKTPKR